MYRYRESSPGAQSSQVHLRPGGQQIPGQVHVLCICTARYVFVYVYLGRYVDVDVDVEAGL